MTDQEKSMEKVVFDQDLSEEELGEIAGGDCSKPSWAHGGSCPRSAAIIVRCPHNMQRDR